MGGFMSTSTLLRERILALLAPAAVATGAVLVSCVVSCAASSGGADGGKTDVGETGVGDAGDAGDASALCSAQTSYERRCFTHAVLIALSRPGQCPPGPGFADAAPTVSETDFTEDGCLPRSKVQPLPDPALTGPVREGDTCCYEFCRGAVCGRPLLVDGRARVASVASAPSLSPGTGWTSDVEPSERVSARPSALATSLAAAWREDACMEHASVASFARFTLELLAFGAPPGSWRTRSEPGSTRCATPSCASPWRPGGMAVPSGPVRSPSTG